MLNLKSAEKAIVLGLCQSEAGQTRARAEELAQYALAELVELAETAGLEVVGEAIQFKNKPDAAYAAGSGKLLELADMAQKLEAEVLVLDYDLSGSQMRNISELTGLKVLDRTLIILDIFAGRATTREGRLQVEIAQLRDRATRLVGAGKALSRLGGGIGTRGPGESKLETDRRHIQSRIAYLKKGLAEVHRQRDLTRSNRDRNNVTKVAVVGYTNAGKSSLINSLADADLLAMDQVFASLDPTARKLKDSELPIILIDTVGFIRNLPHQLVEAFKSTLAEVSHADCIVQVTDLSDPEFRLQMSVVEKLLIQLEAAQKPRIQVFNKIDLADPALVRQIKAGDRHEGGLVFSSVKDGRGLAELREEIMAIPLRQMLPFHLVIPFTEGEILAKLQELAYIDSLTYLEEGADVVFKIRQSDLGLLEPLLK